MSNRKKYIFSLIALAAVICITFAYSFYKNHKIQSLVESIMVFIFIIVFIFIKNKELCISNGLLLFSFVVLLFDPASGYGAVLIYSLVCLYHKTWTKILGVISLLLAIISIFIHKYPIEKSLILIISGLIAYLTVNHINRYKLVHIKLQLTEDEIKILDELQKVKLQKSVTCFSKNIVSKKLQEAAKRNNLISVGELTYCYRLQSD